MKKTAIFYGSTSGNTESIAKKIAEKIDIQMEILEVSSISKADLESFDNLILGTSTWGFGELQDDWDNFLPQLEDANLEGKTIALFGLGDSDGYSDTFVDGMGILYQTIKDKNCKIVGFSSTGDYQFDESNAVINKDFVGLALDEDNEYDKTDQRITAWCEKLKKEFV